MIPAAPQARPRLQLWCPELFAIGGIQEYSRHFLDSLLRSRQVELTDVLSRNDEELPAGFDAPSSIHFSLCGKNGASAGRLSFASTLTRTSLAHRPDLIITTHLFFAPLARWLKRVSGTPYWAVAHGFEAWDALTPRRARAMRSADRVLAVSRFTRDYLTRYHGLDPSRIHLLPNMIDPEEFAPGPRSPELLTRYGLRADQRIILTVARTESRDRYKGYDEIIQLMPEIQRAVPDAHYLLVGEGNDQARLRQLVEDLGLRERVTLATGVPRAELCAHYNLCDLFVMPSRREGFGIVYLEALACGKPVLAGRVDGSVDPLLDGKLGILVDPGNLPQIRNAIIAVLQQRHPHPNLNRPDFLRKCAVEHFGIERFEAKLEEQLADFFRPLPARA